MFLVLFSIKKKKAVICSYNRWFRVLIPKLNKNLSLIQCHWALVAFEAYKVSKLSCPSEASGNINTTSTFLGSLKEAK